MSRCLVHVSWFPVALWLLGCGGKVTTGEPTPSEMPDSTASSLSGDCMDELNAGRNLIPGRFIVGLRPLRVAQTPTARLGALSSKVLVRQAVDVALTHAIALELTDAEVTRLRTDADVSYVEPDGLACAFPGGGKPPSSSCANGAAESTPSGISEINALSRLNTGDGIIVAVVDTGVDLDHPDLLSNLLPGTGFVGNAIGEDDNDHGSHVAGTIAAVQGNSIGVIGVAPNAKITPVKVLDRRGRGSYSNIANGIDWAVQNGARVINLSLGGTADSITLKSAIQRAYDAGVFVAVAAGNDGADANDFYPAAYDSIVITVSAEVPSTNGFASFSNHGVPPIDLAGPGVGICSTTRGGYASFNGTSMATPHVAGAAALYLQGAIAVGASTLPFDVRDALMATAIPLADTSTHSEDLVNAEGL